jgi:hypothetical protein
MLKGQFLLPCYFTHTVHSYSRRLRYDVFSFSCCLTMNFPLKAILSILSSLQFKTHGFSKCPANLMKTATVFSLPANLIPAAILGVPQCIYSIQVFSLFEAFSTYMSILNDWHFKAISCSLSISSNA